VRRMGSIAMRWSALGGRHSPVDRSKMDRQRLKLVPFIDATDASLSEGELTAVGTPQQVETRFRPRKKGRCSGRLKNN